MPAISYPLHTGRVSSKLSTILIVFPTLISFPTATIANLKFVTEPVLCDAHNFKLSAEVRTSEELPLGFILHYPNVFSNKQQFASLFPLLSLNIVFIQPIAERANHAHIRAEPFNPLSQFDLKIVFHKTGLLRTGSDTLTTQLVNV